MEDERGPQLDTGFKEEKEEKQKNTRNYRSVRL